MPDRKRNYKNAERRALESRLDAASRKRRERLRTLLLLLAITVALALLYYGVCSILPYAFLGFYAAAILLGLGYVFSNYCFVRNGVTPDMLPPTMPLEQRRRYVEERDERKRKTNWMLMLLIPLLLVIGLDILVLFWGEPVMKFFRSL
jgi:hypothetical protein